MTLQEQPDSSLHGVRPIPITILCILFLVGGAFLCVSNVLPGLMRDLNSSVVTWYPNYLVAFSVITMICGVGLWKMRAWAFIVYGLIAALNQIVMVFAGDWKPSNLIMVAIFYFILFRYYPRRWNPKHKSEQGGDGDAEEAV